MHGFSSKGCNCVLTVHALRDVAPARNWAIPYACDTILPPYAGSRDCNHDQEARPTLSLGPAMNILLTPARIGSTEMRNRIVMPSMTTRLADPEGHVTDETMAYYMARLNGGVGLITVEMASPQKSGRHRHRELGIFDDRFLSGLTRLVAAIHGGGAKASIQLGHGGGHTRRDICVEAPIAPSAIPHPVFE